MALSWPATKQQKVILEMLQILLHKSAILYIYIYVCVCVSFKTLNKKRIKNFIYYVVLI